MSYSPIGIKWRCQSSLHPKPLSPDPKPLPGTEANLAIIPSRGVVVVVVVDAANDDDDDDDVP